jgi:hypothetical protein
MKFLSLILSIAILAVSFVPCTDNLPAKDDNILKKEITSSDKSSKDHNNTSDNCSPFCTCSCCAATAFYSPLSKTQPIKVIFKSEKYPLYNISFRTEVYYSIWQPPKLS